MTVNSPTWNVGWTSHSFEHGTTLIEVGGVGTVLAARVLADTGSVDRFPTEAHYASYAGVAPVEIASGEHTRHRLSRAETVS